MKHTCVILSITLILLFNISFAQNSNELVVHIKNIELLEGQLFLSLTADSNLFPKGVESEKYRKMIPVDATEMMVSFMALPDGFYALSVFQDLNGNRQLDTKRFGIPAEPFAFSNHALRKFQAPYFEQAKFELNGGGVHEQEIKLIYKKPKKKNQN